MKKKYGEGCKGCIYWRKLDHSSKSLSACHYILDEGKPRGCDAGYECIHYSTDKKRLKQIKEEAERNSRRGGYAI